MLGKLLSLSGSVGMQAYAGKWMSLTYRRETEKVLLAGNNAERKQILKS